MGFAQEVKRKTESIRNGAFKSSLGSGGGGGMVAASCSMDDYGYIKEPYSGGDDVNIVKSSASPVPSMRSIKSGKASYQEHKKNKFSRNGGAGGLSMGAAQANETTTTYHGVGGGGSLSNLIHDDYRPLMDELKETYRKKIRPLETTYNFEGFHSAPLSDSDIEAKPMVLLLGQYSTVWYFLAAD